MALTVTNNGEKLSTSSQKNLGVLPKTDTSQREQYHLSVVHLEIHVCSSYAHVKQTFATKSDLL